jgi:hypothetical protein
MISAAGAFIARCGSAVILTVQLFLGLEGVNSISLSLLDQKLSFSGLLDAQQLHLTPPRSATT